jgi:hypothetical protein
MNLVKYKEICLQTNVIPRGILEDTIVEVRKNNSEVAIRLHTIIMGRPIPRPTEQNNDRYSDYFEISLTDNEKLAVVESLLHSEIEESWMGSLLDTWKAMNEF